jgi:hypothetical protein
MLAMNLYGSESKPQACGRQARSMEEAMDGVILR